MFRKNYFTFLLVTALFLASGIAAFAQNNAPVSGRVELTKSDGTKVPVAGALVEIYRMDQKVKLPSDKTDKKGNFGFAGVQLGSRYVLAVSGAGIAPAIYPNVAPGSDNIVISVTEGDGKRLTEEEVKQQIASRTNTTTTTTQTTTNSEAAKKREEEIRKQNEENTKITKSNEIVRTALTDGDKAFNEGNYDLAITKFEEGYNAKPTFVPSASLFLNNIAASYIRRAGITFNSKVGTDKPAAREAVKNDAMKAIEASEKSLEILKSATPADEKQRAIFESSKITAIKNRKDAYYLIVKYGEDVSKVNETITAYTEYFAIETVPAKKLENRSAFAEILLYIGEYDKALAQYETILTESPNNLDAMAGAGTALMVIGGINNNDKAKYQLAANYLQRFVDAAPATNPKRAEALGMLDTLKKDYKITPKK